MIALILVTAFMAIMPNTYASTALQKNENSFGPYILRWNTFVLCKGPKAKNLSNVEATVQKDGEDYLGHINFTFLTPTVIDEIKIVVSTLKDNAKSILWAYNLKDPCKHFLFASIIEKYLKAHNCAVEKGNYEVLLNFSELTTSLLGQSFFYGEYLMKSNVMSKKGNVMCVSTNMSVDKKEKEKENLKKTT